MIDTFELSKSEEDYNVLKATQSDTDNIIKTLRSVAVRRAERGVSTSLILSAIEMLKQSKNATDDQIIEIGNFLKNKGGDIDG